MDAEYFTPPGLVILSDAALELARSYGDEMRLQRPGEDWIVVVAWWHSRRVREKGTNNWTELGAGLGLAAYERPKVPAKRIHVADGFEYAVKIPADVLDAASAKLIDADRDDNYAFALR